MPLYASDYGFTPSPPPPYSPGDEVPIINCTMGGRYFLEGRAKVVVCRNEDSALVDFGNGEKVERFIDPNAHGMTDAELADHIATLNAPNEQPTECDPLFGRRMDSADCGEC